MIISQIVKSKYAMIVVLITAVFCWIGVGYQYLMVVRESSQRVPEPKSMLVDIYYYNENKAEEIGDPCSPEAIMPLQREIPISSEPIRDTIRLLIRGEIIDEEKEKGFSTEFPHPDFKLLESNLKDRILFLRFTEVPGFTSGGSCRVGLLKAQIEKTANQFLIVDEILIIPEYLFQP